MITDQSTIHGDPRRKPPSPAEVQAAIPSLEVLDILGVGGMGVVYRARQPQLDRIVAVKVLPPDPDRDASFGERFAREARALARLQHPNIVTVHDFGHAGDLYYLVMEYIDGADLRQLMRSGDLDTAQALAIVPKICSALEYAHDEGVTHRDIKPENILVDTRGRVKIADFGLAKLVGVEGAATPALTMPQQVMGTMHYMAPEQVERPTEVDHRADIYALGVVIYELLTGELPIGRFPMPSEKGVDVRLDEVVLHALEKEPAKRYQKVEAMRTDVERISSSHAAPGPAAARHAPSAYAGAPAMMLPTGQKDPLIAYLLWFLIFLGLGGVHRFYAGKWVTGILWVMTGGLFFIGQIVDLFLIPGQIRMANLRKRYEAEQIAAAAVHARDTQFGR